MGEKKLKVALGLSGGVDSAVSAKLLLDQGYDVTGVYLECYRATGCRAEADRQDALAVALQLGIPFQSIDYRDAYRKRVLDYFYYTYESGQTPNPDIFCNQEIKFGLFYDWAFAHGFDFLATGHYARLSKKQDTVQLQTARDLTKDQSYFLALVDPAKWSRVLFPVGELTKKQVRQLATKWQLPVADKKDSTGVCFVGEVPIQDFLGQKVPHKKGPVYRDKKVIGSHNGVAFYTIGQRHGFTIQQNQTTMPTLYVIAKDIEHNSLTVGTKEECFQTQFLLAKGASLPVSLANLCVRIRHLGELVAVTSFTPLPDGKTSVSLSTPIFAPSSGQAAVFYQSDPSGDGAFVVGIGIIS